MKRISILISSTFLLLLNVQSVNAAFITGSNFVTDTDTQIDWLFLSETQGLSYSQVLAETATGGAYEGWVFASEEQIRTFLDNAGGSGNYDTTVLLPGGGEGPNNSGNMDAIYDLWDVYPDQFDSAGFWWGEPIPSPTAAGGAVVWGGDLRGDHSSIFLPEAGHIRIYGTYLSSNFGPIINQPISIENAFPSWGSALVRPAVVPVPAAIWLFGSGLLLLAARARR